jgi:hypothetical protein
VEIKKKHLKVASKDASGQMTVVVDGDLTWECHKEESVWSLVPGEHIHVRGFLCIWNGFFEAIHLKCCTLAIGLLL